MLLVGGGDDTGVDGKGNREDDCIDVGFDDGFDGR